MRARVYCLASAKGGSGKTALCASFAAFLAELGNKALMLDLDAATNGLTLLYLNEVNSHKENVASKDNGQLPKGLFDTDRFLWKRDTVYLPNNVALVPATFSFNIESSIPDIELQSKLKLFLDEVKEQFNYIFLDAQAGSDIYSQVAINRDISHEVIIVSEYDPLSAAGVERLKALLRDDLVYPRTWVLLNKMLPDFSNTFSEFLEVSKYLTPIPWDPDVVRAYARRRLPLDMAYGNQFTLAVMQSLKMLLGQEISAEIDKWAEGRALDIREPIEEQYRDAEKEFKGLLEQKVLLDKTVATRRLIRMTTFVMVPTTVIIVFLTSGRFGILSYIFRELNETVIVVFTMFVAMSIIIFGYMTKLWDKSAEREVEEARFTRQLGILEDKLKRLEILRKADLETLVKEGAKQK